MTCCLPGQRKESYLLNMHYLNICAVNQSSVGDSAVQIVINRTYSPLRLPSGSFYRPGVTSFYTAGKKCQHIYCNNYQQHMTRVTGYSCQICINHMTFEIEAGITVIATQAQQDFDTSLFVKNLTDAIEYIFFQLIWEERK